MAYSGNGLEHRWGERVSVNIPVRVEANQLTGANGCMQNLSLSGALMKSDSDLHLNSLIEVSIALPPPSTRTAVSSPREVASTACIVGFLPFAGPGLGH